MDKSITAKELRANLPRIVERIRRGERFIVVYRSRPAFRLVPVVEPELLATTPLDDDPLYRSGPVGRSGDGLCSTDHDELLYGKARA